MDDASMKRVNTAQRRALSEWVGERPDTVLAIHALASGAGRIWLEGTPDTPHAVLVESALVPAEPQGFGDPDGLLELLEHADSWQCIEVDGETAASMRERFAQRWGDAPEVVDVIHVLDGVPPEIAHPLVRPLRPSEIREFEANAAHRQLLPAGDLVEAAAAAGRLHAVISGDRLLGQGSSFASGERYADVGVAVDPAYRRQRIATAAAAQTCRQLVTEVLVPVWGAGSHNTASLRIAARLGFQEVSRLTYLVRGR
ncbi:GNAT family N-acetyltransferase [Nitriliruptor alkaliphilus]|uniref:GNAT family N-acetyltransferase n=1 Tax=Nitriliruptor alkaliphilus TaxID=427918 RepID=UPI000697F0A5|nr:GNAT family N-acetyltransferase [Nitriliruptor alkaliphilus]